MPYLTIDKKGRETMFAGRPIKVIDKDDKGNDIEFWMDDQPGHFDYGHCDLPKGTIEKIIGRMLPDDECFWLNQEEQIDKAIEHYENYTKDEY